METKFKIGNLVGHQCREWKIHSCDFNEVCSIVHVSNPAYFQYPIHSSQLHRLAVYLSGPMRGILAHNFPAFDAAAKFFRDQGYKAMAHLKEGLNGRRILDVVRAGETDEFVSAFPEWKEPFARIKSEYDAMCAMCDADFARLRSIPVQKDFAAEAVKTRWSGALFSMRSGKHKTAAEYFAAATQQTVERTIGIDLGAILPQVETCVESVASGNAA